MNAQTAFETIKNVAGVTVADLFEDQVGIRPNAIALQTTERALSYAELEQRVNRLCSWLQAQGIASGDRVAILSENRQEFVEALLAAAKVGAILTCMNWRQSIEELRHCINLVSPKIALVSERHAQHAELFNKCASRVLNIDSEYESEVGRQASVRPNCAVNPEDGLYIIYTSGTTGKPKAALVSHRAIISRGVVLAMDRIFRRGTTFIAWPPMFHMVSSDIVVISLMTGGKVIVSDGFQLDSLCESIASEENLGWLPLMPGMIDRVVDEVKRRGIRPQPVDSVGCMPDLIPRHVIQETTRVFNAPFRNTFGSTETGPAPGGGGLIAIGVAPETLNKQQSSLCRVRLVDESGSDVLPGAPGELLIKGPTLFSGYWGMAEATVEAFADGWYHTGDVFKRLADGTLAFVDRRKYLIKSGGENIYPAEIEQLLLASSRIAEAAVVRRGDSTWGEVPIAFVATQDATLTADDVLNICRGRIANYKVPREVRFIPLEDFPRSTTGKIMRHVLEETLRT